MAALEGVVPVFFVLLFELRPEGLEFLGGERLFGHRVEDVVLDVDVVAQERCVGGDVFEQLAGLDRVLRRVPRQGILDAGDQRTPAFVFITKRTCSSLKWWYWSAKVRANSTPFSKNASDGR